MNEVIPYGYCKCGCEEKTSICQKTDSNLGRIKGRAFDYIHGHNGRGSNASNWKGGIRFTGSGHRTIKTPGHPRADNCGYVMEHTLVAEKALGKYLPTGAIVHHVNNIPGDNRPENLVVCQDRAYHSLLHKRQRAFETCGHAHWLKCPYCGKYDNPKNMDTYKYKNDASRWGRHSSCKVEYNRNGEYKCLTTT